VELPAPDRAALLVGQIPATTVQAAE